VGDYAMASSNHNFVNSWGDNYIKLKFCTLLPMYV